MSIAFKRVHFPKFAVLFAAFFHVRYPLSYRDLEEIMAERGVEIDHATLNRCVVRFSPQVADLAQRRNLPAARRFFRKVIASNGVPERVVIDKSGTNLVGLQTVNVILKVTGGKAIEILWVKYLNNILEQDHRFIKRITRPMMGFKAPHSAAATLAGIKVAHMIRKSRS